MRGYNARSEVTTISHDMPFGSSSKRWPPAVDSVTAHIQTTQRSIPSTHLLIVCSKIHFFLALGSFTEGVVNRAYLGRSLRVVGNLSESKFSICCISHTPGWRECGRRTHVCCHARPEFAGPTGCACEASHLAIVRSQRPFYRK